MKGSILADFQNFVGFSTHLRPVDHSTTILWTGLFLVAGCLVSFYYFFVLKKFLFLNANSVDPDQAPRFTSSDLGLHCLPITLLWGFPD